MYTIWVLEVSYKTTRGCEVEPIFLHLSMDRTALFMYINLGSILDQCRRLSETSHNCVSVISTDTGFSYLSVRTPSVSAFPINLSSGLNDLFPPQRVVTRTISLPVFCSSFLYRVIKKFLWTWWLQYRKLQVMFTVSPASLQTFIDTPNCVLEDRVQYSTVHIPNVFYDDRIQIINGTVL
jgi:hypothetical protein